MPASIASAEVNAMMEKCRMQAPPRRAALNSSDNLSDEARTRAALAAARLSVEKLKVARRPKNLEIAQQAVLMRNAKGRKELRSKNSE
jgi:hypothetical protein